MPASAFSSFSKINIPSLLLKKKGLIKGSKCRRYEFSDDVQKIFQMLWKSIRTVIKKIIRNPNYYDSFLGSGLKLIKNFLKLS